jgi:hypothetical protein
MAAPAGPFSADELARLADAPAQAGGLVMAASPSGGAATAQEVAALAAAVGEALQAAAPGTLLEQLSGPLQQLARRVQTDGIPAGGADALESLQAAAALVDSRAAPQDAAAYKAMLLAVAARVARAAREGGFLGIGGQQVSAAEAAALETIRLALGGGSPAGEPPPAGPAA